MHEGKDSFHVSTRRLNLQVSLLLRIFTALSLLLLLAGMVMVLLSAGSAEAEVVSISSLPQELGKVNPAALITLALYIILAMPALIIVISLVHFISTREARPVAVCIVLLLLLGASFIFILI